MELSIIRPLFCLITTKNNQHQSKINGYTTKADQSSYLCSKKDMSAKKIMVEAIGNNIRLHLDNSIHDMGRNTAKHLANAINDALKETDK